MPMQQQRGGFKGNQQMMKPQMMQQNAMMQQMMMGGGQPMNRNMMMPGQQMMGPQGQHPAQQGMNNFRGGGQNNNRKPTQQMQYNPKARNIGQGQNMAEGGPQTGLPNNMPPQNQHQQQNIQQQPQQNQPTNAGAQANNLNFNREFYNSLDVKEKKQYLGEIIYPFVYAREPTTAAKITGMLLEIEDEELINYTKNTESLIRKIEEAANVLKRYNQNAKGTSQNQPGRPVNTKQ